MSAFGPRFRTINQEKLLSTTRLTEEQMAAIHTACPLPPLPTLLSPAVDSGFPDGHSRLTYLSLTASYNEVNGQTVAC